MMRMQQQSHGFLVVLLMVFIAGIVLSGPSTLRRSRVRRQNMKVRISATEDTIVMKFLRPNVDTKLEGYILGYGSSIFSKQFIQLPENGQPYETEIDAEPKYLVVVQPVAPNEVKKQCSGKVELEKPLHLVIGSVTPTSVLLSWGTLLKTPYEGNVMDECIEDGHYTVRYRERNRKWNYQTCPTSETVIDHLKPNAVYEFGVQPSSKDGTGTWSKPVIHNISTGGVQQKVVRKILKRPSNTVQKPLTPRPHSSHFSSPNVLPNKTLDRLPISQNVATTNQQRSTQTTLAPTTTTRKESPSTPGPTLPVVTKQPIGGGDLSRAVLLPFLEVPLASEPCPLHNTATMASLPAPLTNVDKHGGNPLSQPQDKPLAQPLPKPQLQPHYQPPQQPKSYLKQTTIPNLSHKLKLQPTVQPVPQTKPQQTSQPVPQTQPQPTSQPVPQTQPQPTSQPVSQTQAKPTSQPVPQTQAKPTSQPVPQTQPQLTSQPVPQTQPQLTSQPVPQTQPQLTSQPVPQTQPQLTSQPVPQTQPHLTSQPVPQTQPQPGSQPVSQTQPHLTSQPVPQTQQQLTSQPVSPTQPQLTSQPVPPTQPQLTSQSAPPTQPKPTSQPVPQTQPQPRSQFKPQTQPQPTARSTPQTKPQPHPTFQSLPQPITQHKLQAWHPSKPRQSLKSQSQTTTQLHSEIHDPPTSQPKHQVLHETHTQTQAQPQLQVQPTPQPTLLAQSQTPQQPTLRHISHTEQALPKIYIQAQLEPQSQSTTQPQTRKQPQAKTTQEPELTTKQQSTPQPMPKPKTVNFPPITKPQPKGQPKPQAPARPKKQPNIQPRPRTWNQQRQPNIPRRPQLQPPAKKSVPHFQHTIQKNLPSKNQTLSQPERLPKPHPVSKPQPPPQPGLHFQSQTRTYSDPTKVTPRQTVSMAPSPPEEGKPLSRPALATEKTGTGIVKSHVVEVPHSPISSVHPVEKNETQTRTRVPTHSTRGAANGVRLRGNALLKPVGQSKDKPVVRPNIPVNKKTNLVRKPSDHDKPLDLKQGDNESILKPFPPVTAKPKQENRQQTTTSAPAVNMSRFDIYENSSIFRPLPASEVDIMGKKRFIAPHVVYKTDKKPDEPCSITSSLTYFPEEEGSDQNVTGPPRVPPSNLTVVTVEGCPYFVILDWEKSDNETKEYEVVSTTKGPNGEEVSILTTNQTHTAVENLKPESSYEFTVTPKNELGTGPSTDPVSFSTESADPRVSEYVSGKDAIWTQFPFKSDAYSECNGKQFVKRTWYRKFVGIQLCNSLRYKIYLSDSLNGKFYNIGDQTGHGEDHCQFVDSFLDGRTGTQMLADQLPNRPGFFRALRQEPVHFGEIGGKSHITYVGWYECGTPIPGKW
ncbi:target of Nesh-SH3 isoform X2 [Anabas testudineus]|uniref:target of Nesh-SH3 isoform X2 n=1 Tax=Anabas testudineus TaxID=64144 RepID=UPI000E4597BB|nr:target of Nesh-SH3 isoform X2 [Anabas testudineus]